MIHIHLVLHRRYLYIYFILYLGLGQFKDIIAVDFIYQF